MCTSDEAANPVYVSIGHKMSLDTAVKLTVACSVKRVPEPVRQVHTCTIQLSDQQRLCPSSPKKIFIPHHTFTHTCPCTCIGSIFWCILVQQHCYVQITVFYRLIYSPEDFLGNKSKKANCYKNIQVSNDLFLVVLKECIFVPCHL